MAMFFRKNFLDGSMKFLNISHGENTEAQKGHRAAPDFSILAAWRHQRGGIKNRIVSEDETVSRKSGSSGESGWWSGFAEFWGAARKR